jgi:hypothetical protein
MERRTIVVIVSAILLLCLAAGGAALLLTADDKPVAAVTAASSTPTAVDTANAKEVFLKLLREQGVVNGPADEQLAYPEGDMYCRYLDQGLTTQRLMDNAAAAGTPERAKHERVLTAAVQTLCPQHAPKLMPQS